MFTLSGKKKQHKHKLFGPDFVRTFLTLTPGCPGVKKFLPTTGAAGKRTFWCGRPRFSARTSMTRRVVEKLCTKKVCVDFLAPTLTWRHAFICLLSEKGSDMQARVFSNIYSNSRDSACTNPDIFLSFSLAKSGHVRPRQGTEICNFGVPSPLEALHWIFCFFSRFSM